MVIQTKIKDPSKLKKGDFLVYDGKEFDIVTKEDIIKEIAKELYDIRLELESVKRHSETTRENVKNKLNNFFIAFMKGE